MVSRLVRMYPFLPVDMVSDEPDGGISDGPEPDVPVVYEKVAD